MNATFDNDDGTTGGPMDGTTAIPPFEFSDYTQRAIVATMILIISLVGIVGNTMVQLAVLLSKKLRTATNAFVVNLSMADLLTCVVIPWNAVALLGTDGLPVSEWFCKIVATIQFTTVGCSIYTLACIGLNRLLLITKPMTSYRKFYTPRKIAVWLIFTWLIPFMTSLIPPLVNVGAVGYNEPFHFCGSKPHPLYMAYNLIIATFLYPIPLVTIIVSYTLIWRHLRRHAKKLASAPKGPAEPKSNRYSIPMMSQSEGTTDSDQPQLSANSGTLDSMPARKRKRQTDVTKNMAYVVCGFGLCLTPYAINLFFDDDGPGIPYTTAILLLNNCINPFIYATKHRDFKTVFGCILRRRWDKIPQPSDFLKTLRRTRCCGTRD